MKLRSSALLLSLIAAVGLVARAEVTAPPVLNDMKTPADNPMLDCPIKNRPDENNRSHLGDLSRAISASFGGQTGDGKVDAGADWAKSCKRFFDEQGNLGDWGKHLMSTLDESKHAALFKASDDITAICPKFESFDTETKKKFNLWGLSAGSFRESSCKESVEGKGPNGIAKGLFQLHKGREPGYPGRCRRGDANNGINSITCTLNMLNAYREKAPGGNLFTTRGKTYWAIFRADPHSSEREAPLDTCARMRQFSECGNAKQDLSSKSKLKAAHKECQEIFNKIKSGGRKR